MVDAHDYIGNGGGDYELAERFGSAALVTNDATVEDAEVPELADLTITPNEFDTRVRRHRARHLLRPPPTT